MKKLIFITGCQGSGKTYFARELMRGHTCISISEKNSTSKMFDVIDNFEFLLIDGVSNKTLINNFIKNIKTDFSLIIISNVLKIDDIDFKFFDTVVNVKLVKSR